MEHRGAILVVEDDPDFATMVAEALRFDRYQVHVAKNGATALEMARATAMDAVLLDLELPDFTGFEIARTLRSDVIAKEAIIIMLTGYKGSLQDADAAGIDLMLTKPVTSELLGGLIEYFRRQRADTHRQLR